MVILVTDDTFLERPDNYGDRDGDGLTDKTDFPREGNHPALRTLVETTDALRNNRTRVFSFTRIQQPGPLARCSTGRRLPWTAITNGWSTPYDGADPTPGAHRRQQLRRRPGEERGALALHHHQPGGALELLQPAAP